MHPSEALSPNDAFGSRFVAIVLDLTLCAVAAGPLPGASGWVMAGVFFLLYLGVFQGFTGWSFSKAVLGAKVVKVGTLDPPGPIRGLVRMILAPIDILIVGWVLVIINPRRRRLGDQAGSTEVVGLAPAPRVRAIYGLAYLVVMGLFILFSSVNAFLIIGAIFIPILVGFAVVILGSGRHRLAWPWLVGLAYCLPAASYMSFASLCRRGEGTCTELGASHKAIPALVILVIAIVIVFAFSGAWVRWAVAGLVGVAEIWLAIRLWDVTAMRFGAILCGLFLLFGIGVEYSRYVARKRAEQLGELGPTPA